MMPAFNTILTIHIIAGALSLIAFWIPVFIKKGGDIHVKVGKFYVWMMWIVVVTAAMLSVLNIFRGRLIAAAFLGFLSVLTSYPLWYGIMILKHKKGISETNYLIRKVLNATLFLGAIGLIVWSLVLQVQGEAILLLIFGVLGLSSGTLAFENFDKASKGKNWLFEHLNGMIGSGIAAYTAFLAFGGTSLFGNIFKGQIVVILWVLPSIIGTFFIMRYKRKLAKGKNKM